MPCRNMKVSDRHPLQADFHSQCRGGACHNVFIRLEVLTTEILLILFHQVDNKPDSALNESCDFWKSFIMVLRSRISTRQELVWENPIRPIKRDTRKTCHGY